MIQYDTDLEKKCQHVQSKDVILNEIQKKYSWGKEQEAEEFIEEFRINYPDCENEMEYAIETGIFLKKCWDDAWQLGTKNRPESDLEEIIQKLKARKIGDFEEKAIKKVKENFDKGRSSRKRGTESKNYKSSLPTKEGQYDSFQSLKPNRKKEKIMLTGIHGNALCQMNPSKKWTVMIDETGEEFSPGNPSPNPNGKKKKPGKIVGIFIPEGTELPKLKNWHAVDKDIKEIEQVIKSLLTNPCGVLGVAVNALPRVNAEQWFAGIEILLDMAFRLIPIEEETVFDVMVEQRGCANQEMLRKTCDDVLNRFRRLRPDLARKITINPKLIRKEDHPYNGYPDAAAFIWGKDSSCKKIFDDTKWRDTCMLNRSERYSLCDIIDLMESEQAISPELWTELAASEEAESKNSFISAILRQLGEFARGDVKKWLQYMKHTARYLDSKAIDMDALSKQVNWLKEFTPDEETFLPRLRLIWLTVNLARENHAGETLFNRYMEEFDMLSKSLYEEDAPLVCNAQLHLAVSLTNEFDFNGAAKVLESWRGTQPAVPGLQLYGRLLSSFGQHEAFLKNYEKAADSFRKAIEVFEKLSDPEEAKKDISQTRAYLVNVMMDNKENMSLELEKELSLYFGSSLKETAESLSCSNNSEDKYKHHLLLRFLVTNGSDEAKDARKIYLDHLDEWKSDQGHPWELIEFYRGFLFDDAQKRASYFRKAREIVKEGGLVLKIIDAVIWGSLLTINPEEKEDYLLKMEQMKKDFPFLEERLLILSEQATAMRPPLELANAVLPFNFR